MSSKILKFRFSKEIIISSEEIAWWNWTHDEIASRIDNLKDIREFIYKYSK